MIFYLSKELSGEPSSNIFVIEEIIKELNDAFKDSFYGENISKIYIGFICVKPEFKDFCRVRKNYIDTKKNLLSLDVSFDYELFNKMSKEDVKKNFSLSILNTITQQNFKAIDVFNLHDSLKEFFQQKKWIL